MHTDRERALARHWYRLGVWAERQRIAEAYGELAATWRERPPARTWEQQVADRLASFGPPPPPPVQTADWPALRFPPDYIGAAR